MTIDIRLADMAGFEATMRKKSGIYETVKVH